jgi:hypothetical protein
MNLTLLSVLVCLVASVTAAGSSKGDQHPWFQKCLERCIENRNCTDTTDNVFGMLGLKRWDSSTHLIPEMKASLILRLTLWDCEADCKYVCMRQHNQMRKDEDLHVLQYYGKWPFRRVRFHLNASTPQRPSDDFSHEPPLSPWV